MRRGMGLIAGMAAVCGLMTFAPQPSRAAGVEKSLLGVRILQTYREVLKLYGAPTRVYNLTETVLVQEAYGPDGDMTGGIVAIGEGTNSGGPGGPPGGGGPNSGGGPGSGGGMPGAPGRSGGARVPGSGGMPGSGGGGAGIGGSGEGTTTFGQAGGYVWAYHYPFTEKLYLFVFNAQGRLLLAFERGRSGGGATSNGINLGSSLKSVYEQYGWPDNVEEQGTGTILNYSQKHHLLVAVLKGKVVGLAVSLFELPKMRMIGLNDSGNGNGGGGGGGKGGGGGGTPRGAGGGGGGSAPPSTRD